MRIKWFALFKIPNSTVQLGEAYIRVTKFDVIDSKTVVEYIMTDDNETELVKMDKVILSSPYVTIEQVLAALQDKFFVDSVIVD